MFISWTRHHGRSEALAGALGVRAEFIAVGHLGNRRTVVWRHAVQAVRTIAVLARHRPSVLYVMAPPLPLMVLGLAYQRLTGRPLVVDAHTAAFVDARGRPRRWSLRLARHARATIVTTDALRRLAAEHGVDAVALHDPPLGASAPTGGWPPPRPRVVMPASWWADEPLTELRDAAALVPEVDLMVTGRPSGPLADPTTWPANTRLTGWVDEASYAALVGSATALLALTTRDLTMQRAGYEALILGRPAIVSDTTVLREYFTSGAVITAPNPADLAAAIRAAVDDAPRLSAEMTALRSRKQAEFAAGLDELAGRLAPSPPEPISRCEAGAPAGRSSPST